MADKRRGKRPDTFSVEVIRRYAEEAARELKSVKELEDLEGLEAVSANVECLRAVGLALSRAEFRLQDQFRKQSYLERRLIDRKAQREDDEEAELIAEMERRSA